MQKLSLLGKDLVRRSKSRCEICDDSACKLSIYQVKPIPSEPDINKSIFICENCMEQIENPKKINTEHWRCLNNSIWSEVDAVKVMAVRLLKLLEDKTDWASELLEQVYLDEEIELWIESESL